MNTDMKITTYVSAVLISMLMVGNVALASEVTGTLSNLGGGVEGVVISYPVVSLAPGTYSSKQSVALTASNASSIHYTTNGTTPTCSAGSVYENPIVISLSQNVRAVSCYPGDVSSGVSSFAYTLSLIDGNGANVVPSSATVGEASLPTGATRIMLTDSTVLDLSNSTSSQQTTDATVGGHAVELTQSVMLYSGVSGQPIVLANSSLGNVTASIPDGTKIQSPDGWDGKIMPPIAGTSIGGNAPAGFSVGNTAVSIGSPDVTLIFNNPVAITLAGIVGVFGYRPSGSNTWIQITNACDGNYDAPRAPVFPGECAISNGIDTKIVTYHFTTFGSLVVIPAATIPASSGGGGGASVVGSVGTFNAPVISTVTATSSAAITATTTVSTTTVGVQGQVLGAAAYNFTKNLNIGSRGADVTALQ